MGSVISVVFYTLVFLVLRGTLTIKGGIKFNFNRAHRWSMSSVATAEYQRFIAAVARSMLWYPFGERRDDYHFDLRLTNFHSLQHLAPSSDHRDSHAGVWLRCRLRGLGVCWNYLVVAWWVKHTYRVLPWQLKLAIRSCERPHSGQHAPYLTSFPRGKPERWLCRHGQQEI